MTVSNTKTACLLCSALITAGKTRCDECGASFNEGDSNTSSRNHRGGNQTAGHDAPSRLGDESSAFDSIFEMADDVEHQTDEFPLGSVSPAVGSHPPAVLRLSGNGSTHKQASRNGVPQLEQPDDLAATKETNAGLSTVSFDNDTPLPPNQESKMVEPSDIIRLACNECGRKLRVRKDRAGKRIKCPKCEAKIAVPRPRSVMTDLDSSPRHQVPLEQAEIHFADLAKELEKRAEKSATDDSSTKDKKQKKSLSGRRFRQLTRILEEEGISSSDAVGKRADALRELGQSGDPRALDFLMADLENPNLQVRQAAVVGLGDLGERRAVPTLVALLDDHSMVIRKAAVLGLGKLKDPRAIKPLLLFGLVDPQMKFLASEAVLGIGEAGHQALIDLLEASELGVVLEAIVLLGRMKATRARRALMSVIDSREQLLQCHAIEALGHIGDPKSIGPLTRLLESKDANVRVTATAALSKMASQKNTVPALVKVLKDPDEDVVALAAQGLGESGDKRAAEPLSSFLNSSSEKVRVAAAQALGALGDKRAVPQLLRLLNGSSEETQIKVLISLRALEVPHISGEMLTHLHHPKAAVRRRVVDVLGLIGDAEVAEQLEQLLRTDPADEVRMACAKSLGEIADPASVECLKDVLHNDEFNVRCQAIGALGQIGDEECYRTLIGLLDDQVAEVKFHAATALGEVGDKQAVPKLKELLKEKNQTVVRGASKALEKLGEKNVENQVKSAQRSRKVEAVHGAFDTIKSYLPESARTQKIILGGSLAVLVLALGAGWLVVKMFQGPPEKVVIRGNVQTISFLPDNSTIAVGRTFGLTEIWKTDGSRPSDKFTPPPGRILATPQPGVFALISGTAVQLWQEGQEELAQKSGHSKPIIRFVVTPDLNLMGTMSTDGVALVWDLKTGDSRAAVQLPAKNVIGFALSADGSLFAGGNNKGGVTIWNAASGEAVQQLKAGSSVLETCFSPDGTLLAVSTTKKPLSVFNVETGEQVTTLPESEGLSQLQFSPDGGYLLGQAGSGFLVWNAKILGDAPGTPMKIDVEVEEIDAVAISRDGTKLAVGGKRDSAVLIYDLADGKLESTLDAK